MGSITHDAPNGEPANIPFSAHSKPSRFREICPKAKSPPAYYYYYSFGRETSLIECPGR
jgi:hypothetical protein